MLASGSQIGKYVLGKKLGQGGFGVVFRAHDASLDREVALKFLNEEASSQPQILQRFLQEARSAAKIAHPGIVTVYECGLLAEANNAAYIAMELLDGESLTDRLTRSGRLPPEDAMEITRQVASALEAAHRAGIVHRDLKPDNVFLVRDPAVFTGERVKVLDFGIAKLNRTASSSVQTQSMMVFGTPRYMSPEQCKSAAHVDHRSDIYTLGCILFELVCGRPPFNGAPGELIAQHVLVEPPPVSSIAPDVPYSLAALIAAMLAKEPDDRPQTMAAVQRQLESVGAMTPGVAPTLLPGAVPQPPRVSASHRVRPPTTPGAVPANPTTLGAAVSSSVVRREPRRKRFIVGALAAAGAIAATILVWIALRNPRSVDEPKQVAAAPPVAVTPDVKPIEPTPRPAVKAPVVEPAPVEPRKAVVETRVAAGRAKVTPKTVKRPEAPKAAASGTLTITAKPSCEIQIDGGGTFHTPIRGFKLPVGRHKITLVNAEYNITDSFVVDIEPGDVEVINKDYSDRLPKPVVNKDRTIDPTKGRPPAGEKPGDPPKPAKPAKDKTINPFAKQPTP
jgi:serine/threonine-protein kinase